MNPELLFGAVVVVLAVLALGAKVFPKKEPPSAVFQCARCGTAARHDDRTINAWRAGKTTFFCRACHGRWLASQPARGAAERAGKRNAGCLGALMVVALLPVGGWFLRDGLAHASTPFARDDARSIEGTSWAADIDLAPAFLVERFGAPAEGDALRVSGRYTFAAADGDVFTVYDYRATTVWATDEDLPDPATFWRRRTPQALSIGSAGGDAAAFAQWLHVEQQAWRDAR